MTLGGLGVLDIPNSSGWPPMVCQGWAPMDQLSKSRTNTHPQQCHCLPAPWFFQRVQTQDPKKFHKRAIHATSKQAHVRKEWFLDVWLYVGEKDSKWTGWMEAWSISWNFRLSMYISIFDFLGNMGVSVGPVTIREIKGQHDKPVRSDGKYGQRLVQDG